MAMAISISIPRWKVIESIGQEPSHVAYCIECHDKDTRKLVSSTWRRFREFHALSCQLRARGLQAFEVPPRLCIGPVDAENRRLRLEIALQAYLQAQVTLPHLVSDWLQLPPEKSVEKAEVAPPAKTFDGTASVAPETNSVFWNVCLVLLAAGIATARPYLDSDVNTFLLGFLAGSCLTAMLILGSLRLSQPSMPPKHHAVDDKFRASDAHVPQVLAQHAADLPQTVQQSAVPLPAAVEQSLESWFEVITLNLRDDVNFQGHKWKHMSQSRGVDIFSSEMTGVSRRVWKASFEMTLRGSANTIKEHLFHWPNRLRWDVSFSEGAVILNFDNDCELVRYKSHPAAGGAVASREFVDVHTHRDLADGGFLSTQVSVSAQQIPQVPAAGKGNIRGECQPGCGLRVTPLPPKNGDASGKETRWKVEMLGNVDLKGWIPVKVLNLAMSGSMTDTCVAMREYYAKLSVDDAS